MLKNINEAINIVLTIFIFYYLMNHVFHITLFDVSPSLKENFFTKLVNQLTYPLFGNIRYPIKEHLANIKNTLGTVDNKLDKLDTVNSKLDKVDKEMNQKKSDTNTCEMADDMVEHLNQIIEDHDDAIQKTKNEECNSNEYIYSNYKPSSKSDDVKEYTTVDSSQLKNFIEMKMDVGKIKKVSSDNISNSPNYKTDVESNAYVNNMNSYCNENQLSGGNINGIYAYDNEVSEFGSFM